jgi:hypothetical protein
MEKGVKQMARKSKTVSLYTVTVTPVGEKRMPLIANFTDEREAWDYAQALKGRDDVADVHMSWPYKVNKTAEEALETFMLWMR